MSFINWEQVQEGRLQRIYYIGKTMIECPSCGSNKTERNGYCASCNHERRKEERNALKVKVVKPIRKVAPKRAAQMREYYKLEKEYLECHPCCEVPECHRKSTQVHHMAGRQNEDLLNVDLFFAVCGDHYERITRDSKWALDNGFLILRST